MSSLRQNRGSASPVTKKALKYDDHSELHKGYNPNAAKRLNT